MNNEDKERAQARAPGVSTRTVEIATALVVLAFAALTVIDAIRLGRGWAPDGPEAGFYPFYVGIAMGAAAIAIIVQQFRGEGGDRTPFVSPSRFGDVLRMLLPSIAYVAVMYVLGLYVASALFLVGFMMWQGKYKATKAVPVAVGVPAVAFVLFEIWFNVPLPKGPVEALFGY